MKRFFENLSRNDIRNTLAVLYVLLVLLFLYVLAFHPVPPENKDLVNVLGGTVIGGIGGILSYFFGASKTNKAES